MFNTKFFFVEVKFILGVFGRTRQYLREDLYTYVRRFHKKALSCCDLVAEEVLVDLCLHRMMKEYRVFLENLSSLLLSS